MTLQEISFRSQRVNLDLNSLLPPKRAAGTAAAKAPARLHMENFLRYECVISGTVRGPGAEEEVSTLSRRFQENLEIAPWAESVELIRIDTGDKLANQSTAAGDKVKMFTLVIKYTPMDWYDESTNPKVK